MINISEQDLLSGHFAAIMFILFIPIFIQIIMVFIEKFYLNFFFSIQLI